MTKPLDQDLRKRIVAAVEAGAPCRAAAKRFGVSESAAIKLMRRYRATGSLAPDKVGGHRRPILEAERDWLLQRIADQADITVRALADELAERGIVVSHVSVWNLLRRENQTHKKSVLASEQNGPDVTRRRWQWRQRQALIDPARLVFIDETWTKTNMAPLRGWAARGARLRDHVPHGRWKTLTFIAALRYDRLTAPCLFDGPINGESFRAYVEQVLLPTLQPGDIVVMDNLGSHKGKAVRQAIRSVGAHRLFLPAYSPDLNPIEQVFAKLKTLLRKARTRSAEAVSQALAEVLRCFSPDECANYLVNSGYASV